LYNYAAYTQPFLDPLFRATRNVSGALFGYSNTTIFYRANQPVSILAMSQQYQFCHSSNFSSSCLPLRSNQHTAPNYYHPEKNNYTAFNQRQRSTAGIIWESIGNGGIPNTLTAQGQSALVAQTYSFGGSRTNLLSAGLPDSQWQIEAQHLHNMSLAALQLWLVENAAPRIFEFRPGESSVQFLEEVTRPEDVSICKSQKVRNDAYSSFSVLGLSIILAVGSFIILLNLLLADMVFFVRSRLTRFRKSGATWVDTKQIDWYSTQALQLHRMAMQGKGVGVWEGEASLVPVLQKKHKKFRMNSWELEPSQVPLIAYGLADHGKMSNYLAREMA
jgi:hypothetical protein